MAQSKSTILSSTKYLYNYSLLGSFSDKETTLLDSCLERFFTIIGENLGGPLLTKNLDIKLDKKSGNNYQGELIRFNPTGLTEWTVTHELAHALDASHGWKLSQQMRVRTGSGFPFKALHVARPTWKLFWYRVGNPPPPCGIDKNFNSLEDFAETVTAFIYPDEAKRRAEMRGFPYEKWGFSHFHDTPRGQYFKNLVSLDIKITPS